MKWVRCYCGVGVRLLGHHNGVSMKLVGTWKIQRGVSVMIIRPYSELSVLLVGPDCQVSDTLLRS